MNPRTRSTGIRALAIALATALLSVSAPDPAAAEPRHERAERRDHRQDHRREARHDRRHRREDRREARHDRRHHRDDRREARRDRRHRRDDRHPAHGRRVIVHGEHCALQHGHVGRYRPGSRHAVAARGYYCKPCGHRFSSRDRFHRHVVHDHHVPLWRLPLVIVFSSLGWVFVG